MVSELSSTSNMSNQTAIANSSISLNFIQPTKLNRSNYLAWKTQACTSIVANRLEGFINGNSVSPTRYLTESEGESSGSGIPVIQRQENPDYITWMKLISCFRAGCFPQ